MKTIYNNQLPQTLIKEISEDETLYISAKIIESAHIAAEPSSLREVVEFHKANNPAQKIHVIALDKNDALVAIESRTSFTYNDVDYQVSKLNREEQLILSLKFAGPVIADDYAKKLTSHIIKQRGAIATQSDISAIISGTSAPVSDEIHNHANRIKAAIANRIKKTMTITNFANMIVKNVESGKEVDVDDMLKDGGVYVNSVVTGGFKTVKGTELLERGGRGLYVCHRRTIAGSNVPFATHYENIKIGSESRIRTLKTVVNSISKGNVQEFVKAGDLDVLVIDEVAQVLRHIAYGSFDARNSDRVSAYTKLMEAVKKARVVYVADADANDTVIEFIRKARGQDEMITLYQSANRNLGVEAVLDDYKAVEARALAEARTGKAFLAVDNASFVEKHARKLVKEGHESLGLTADNIKDYSDLLANTDTIAEQGNLIFSPAITSSVSITNGDYTGNYGLFSGNIIAGDAVQMLRRDRAAKQFIVGVKPHNEILIDDADELLVKQNSDMTDFDKFAAKIEAEDNYIRNNITSAVVVGLELAGFSTRISKTQNEEEQEQAKQVKTEATQEHNTWKTQELLKATPASKKAISESKEYGESTQQVAIQRERAELERAMGTNAITEEDINKAWKDGALVKHIRNLELARMDSKTASAKSYNEKNIKKASRDRFDYAAHHDFFSIILKRLGIDLNTLEGSFTTDDANALGEVLHERRVSFNKLSLNKKIAKKKPVSFSRAARDILRELGIETDSGKVARKEDGMTRVFTVKPESAARLVRYLANRKQANLTI